MKKNRLLSRVLVPALVAILAAPFSTHADSTAEDIVRIAIYSGGAPWDPQINVIYEDGTLKSSYHWQGNEDRGEEQRLSDDQREEIMAAVAELDINHLDEEYVDRRIADGDVLIIRVVRHEGERSVRVSNMTVEPVNRFVRRINVLAPADIQLIEVLSPYDRF